MKNLDKSRLLDALARLGHELNGPTQLVIGGAGALLLTDHLQRTTMDCDVLSATPDMGQLQDAIRAIADREQLVPGWLNGSAQAFVEILPPDYLTRAKSLPRSGRLQVLVLHRQDVIVMKLFAGRPRDLQDITSLGITTAEIDFAVGQLPRLSNIDASRAQRMSETLKALRS
jgi:Nucleotidyltransferase of unknown function (DUF6036)